MDPAELARLTNDLIQQMRDSLAPTVITGTAGHDLLFGTSGNDVMLGGAGSNILFGGEGHNTFIANDRDGTADMAFGGQVADSFIWSPGSGFDFFDGGLGIDVLALQDVSLQQFIAGLRVEGLSISQLPPHGVLPVFAQTADGFECRFVNFQGQQLTMTGQVWVGGACVNFANTERITS
ncbi:hypothetical protein [Falsiroseomonas tokyonensis]|uniref:Calcium-binding protein n=1 Tax=Falsiroseomonas tokyonensis TaxID=430521 RepID=A0ABV7C0F0_9PROT|nr:hypothetical protein [Falsiroseomonas tokyonensis]MBU8541373.1 hypothetical protein [Falsiroseomonas tokyonensis]